MEIYILQENYTEYVPEAGWDENGSYDEDVEHRDIIGVYPSLCAAASKLAEICQWEDSFYAERRNSISGYEIYVGDTDTCEVRWVARDKYEEMVNEQLKA